MASASAAKEFLVLDSQHIIPSGQDSAMIVLALIANHSIKSGSSCPPTELFI